MSGTSARARVAQTTSTMRLRELAACIGMMAVSLCMFRPTYLPGFDSVFGALEYVVSASLCLYVIARHARPNLLVIAVWLYCAVVIGSSLVNGNLERWSLLWYLRIALYSYYYQVQLSEHPGRVYTVTFWILFLLCAANVAAVFLFPSGLYTDVRIHNEYYTAFLRGWFFGLKNNQILWYLALVFLSSARDRWLKGSYRPTLRTFLCVTMTLAAVAFTGSSTSTVVLGTVTLLLVFGTRLHGALAGFKPASVCMALLVVWLVLVVFSGFGFLNDTIREVFDKDVTFSGRSVAWSETLRMVARSPLIGYGLQSATKRTLLLGSVEYVNSHNQILEILYVGGALALAAASGAVLALLRKAGRGGDSEKEFLVSCILLALGIEMLFEVVATSAIFWFLLVLAYASMGPDAGRTSS